MVGQGAGGGWGMEDRDVGGVAFTLLYAMGRQLINP